LAAAIIAPLLVLTWALAAWQRPASAAVRYHVVDGDTLEFTPPDCLLSLGGIACLGQRLRLYGVDAFESKQTCRDSQSVIWQCGGVATGRRRELVASPEFACNVDHEFVDRHAREFAVCTIAGKDVGAILVREGLAFAYGRGSQYLPVEAEAKREKRGAW